MAASPRYPASTTVTTPQASLVLIVIAIPLLCMAGALGLNVVANWISGWTWVPFGFAIEAFVDLPFAGRMAILAVLGLLVAAFFLYYAFKEHVTVTCARRSVRVTVVAEGIDKTFTDSEVTAIFLDEDYFVVQGQRGSELFRHKSMLNRADLAEACAAYGLPWRVDGDPFADEFRRWVPDIAGLPPGADALFTARQAAIEDADTEDIAQLRDELHKLGVIVRDSRQKQYWRLEASEGPEEE